MRLINETTVTHFLLLQVALIIYFVLGNVYFLDSADTTQMAKAGFEVSIKASKNTITLGDVIQVDLLIKHPSEYVPDVDGWLANLQAIENPCFDILSETTDQKNIKDTIKGIFSLTPNRTGSIIWAPGIMQFTKSDDKSSYSLLITPISISCAPSQLTAVNYEPLLPLYPEKAVQLNEKMQLITFADQKYLEEQEKINIERFDAHKDAWTIATIFFLSFAVMAIVFWIIIQYDLLAKQHSAALKKQDTLLVAKRQCLIEASTHEEYWARLLYLFQIALGRLLGENYEVKNTQELKLVVEGSAFLSADEKSLLSTILVELDDALYAHIEKSKESSMSTSKKLLEWVQKRVG